MSVRVNDRGLSSMEYVHNAQQILFIVKDRITKYVNKISSNVKYKDFMKHSLYSVWNSPIYQASMIYQYVQMANKERDYNKRLDYLYKANQTLGLLESSLQTFYDSFKKVVKDKFIILITDKIDYERKLLKGCKNYVSRNVSC